MVVLKSNLLGDVMQVTYLKDCYGAAKGDTKDVPDIYARVLLALNVVELAKVKSKGKTKTA